MKSFDQTFSKVCAGQGRAALVARRNERNSLHAVFGSFCGNFAKKNGNSFLTSYSNNQGAADGSPFLRW